MSRRDDETFTRLTEAIGPFFPRVPGRWRGLALASIARGLALASIAHGPRAAFTTALAKKRGAKQKTREFAGLVSLIRRQRPKTVLEIGTFHGGTLWAWCRLAAPDATIISIDLPGGEGGGGYDDAGPLLRYGRRDQTLHLLQVDSHLPATVIEVERRLDGRKVDFAFIDGDHTYAGVKQDFDTYRQFLAPDGIVAFHDTLPHNANTRCEVDRLWRELAPRFQTAAFEDPSDVGRNGVWGGIGVLLAPLE